jgi:hypothetical protein
MSKHKARFDTLPNYQGHPAAALLIEKQNKDGTFKVDLRFIPAKTGREAQFSAEQQCEELFKDPDTSAIVIMAVAATAVRKAGVTPTTKLRHAEEGVNNE